MKKAQYFFSYARKDSDFVLKLATELRAANANLWLDQLDIVGGQRWDRVIEEALRTCEGMIVVLSPDSVASDNVMDEVSYALEHRKLVVPVRYRDCSFPFRLRRVQYIDFTQSFENGLGQLLRALGVPHPSPRTESTLSDEAVVEDHAWFSETTPKVVPDSKQAPLSINEAQPEGGIVRELFRSSANPTPSATRSVEAPEGLENKAHRHELKWRPLAMHLIIGIGLLSFNNRLLRSWIYPFAFVYSVLVGGDCIFGVGFVDFNCSADFTIVSFGAGIGLYFLGFVDIALGVYYKAQGRRISFWR